MPLIRVEAKNQTIAANSAVMTFGPWPEHVLIRSVAWLWSYIGTVATRTQNIRINMYPSQQLFAIAECAANGVWNDGNVRAGQGTAFPGILPHSTTDTSLGAVTGSGLFVNIPIPYNLIVPQAGTLTIAVDNAQVGDTISNGVLCLEYGREAAAKRGGPPSSKNNP